MIDIAATDEWRKLKRLHAKAPRLRHEFARDPARAQRFSREAAGLFVDFSKNRITDEILHELCSLAHRADVDGARARMFAGERINSTERRAALHVALRDRSGRAWSAAGENVSGLVRGELGRIEAFISDVQSGAHTGCRDDPLDTVVNIGIGGSDLGPQLAVEALQPYWIKGRRTLFVSNIDGRRLGDALRSIDPARTLFVVASKTFTTDETMTNAESARAFLLARGAKEADIARHFVALSTNGAAVAAFGIPSQNMFGFWDWVGGRFSLWSVIGLSIALQVGFANFGKLLDGAADMDRHFEAAPIEENVPALLALIGIWNRNFEGAAAHAILPYDQRLARLPAYLQQLEMESNGKGRRVDGTPVSIPTSPVIFGEPGTGGQHAFHQLLHQGTDVVSADFIAAAASHDEIAGHHEKLLANFLAQTEALMRGRTEAEARAELAAEGRASAEIDRLAPHKVFPGDRPTTSILVERLTPESLGALIALYEHKTFVEGIVWGINSFDQWGVELGKTLAKSILPELEGGADADHDSSTAQLIDRIKTIRGSR